MFSLLIWWASFLLAVVAVLFVMLYRDGILVWNLMTWPARWKHAGQYEGRHRDGTAPGRSTALA